MNRPQPNPRAGQEGVALMVVLLFILLLSVIIVEYAYETEVDASLAMNRRAELQAYVAAKSAVASGLSLLEMDLTQPDQTGTTDKSGTVPTTGQTPGVQSDSLLDVWAMGVPYEAVNDSVMQCTVVDECGKLNLNALFFVQQTQDGTAPQDGTATGRSVSPLSEQQVQENPLLIAALMQLFQNMGLEEDPTDAILDWLDPDDDPRPNGAESDYYSALDPPYACKNGPMDSIEELLLIKGITPEIYFDCLANMQGDQMKQSGTQPAGKRDIGKLDLNKDDSGTPVAVWLADLLTVHGDLRGRVNANTAKPELLMALLAALGDTNSSSVDAILQAREQMPFESLQDLITRGGLVLGAPPPAPPASGTQPGVPPPTAQQSPGNCLDVRSSMFRIWGDGRSGDVMVRVEAFVYRDASQAMAQGGMAAPGKDQFSLGANDLGIGISSGETAAEFFRIVDWRVVR